MSQAWGEVSSAKLQTSISFKTKNRSFWKIFKKIGPRTEPCGTPLSNKDQELKVVLIVVPCQRLLSSLLFLIDFYRNHRHSILLATIHDLLYQMSLTDP